MRYVKIENSLVTNVTVFDDAKPDNWDTSSTWIESATAQIGWQYVDDEFVAPEIEEAIDIRLPTPVVFGLAALTIADGEVAGLDNAAGIGAAFLIDTGQLWVFLTESKSSYVVFIQTPVKYEVTEQYEEYFVVSLTDENGPVNPSSIALQLIST